MVLVILGKILHSVSREICILTRKKFGKMQPAWLCATLVKPTCQGHSHCKWIGCIFQGSHKCGCNGCSCAHTFFGEAVLHSQKSLKTSNATTVFPHVYWEESYCCIVFEPTGLKVIENLHLLSQIPNDTPVCALCYVWKSRGDTIMWYEFVRRPHNKNYLMREGMNE